MGECLIQGAGIRTGGGVKVFEHGLSPLVADGSDHTDMDYLVNRSSI